MPHSTAWTRHKTPHQLIEKFAQIFPLTAAVLADEPHDTIEGIFSCYRLGRPGAHMHDMLRALEPIVSSSLLRPEYCGIKSVLDCRTATKVSLYPTTRRMLVLYVVTKLLSPDIRPFRCQHAPSDKCLNGAARCLGMPMQTQELERRMINCYWKIIELRKNAAIPTTIDYLPSVLNNYRLGISDRSKIVDGIRKALAYIRSKASPPPAWSASLPPPGRRCSSGLP